MMLIATANTAGNPCGATGSRSPASPAPWRSRPAAESGRAKSRVAGLWRRAEADLGAAAAARRLDVEGRRAQVRGRRGDEFSRYHLQADSRQIHFLARTPSPPTRSTGNSCFSPTRRLVAEARGQVRNLANGIMASSARARRQRLLGVTAIRHHIWHKYRRHSYIPNHPPVRPYRIPSPSPLFFSRPCRERV
jgi:hypothetical protein